jgi:hypothetical protein
VNKDNPMSSSTLLQIAYATDASIDVDEHAERIHAILQQCGYNPETLNNLRDAFADGESEFGGWADGLLSIIEQIAKLVPGVKFHARATGEEFRDTWVREFEDGKAVFAAGPWDYEGYGSPPLSTTPPGTPPKGGRAN